MPNLVAHCNWGSLPRIWVIKRRIAVGVAMALALAAGAVPQTAVAPKHRVVVELSDPQGPAWSELLVHVNNLVANFVQDGGVEVEVVFLGPGLDMLRKTNTTDEKRLNQLAEYGVSFVACQNSMAAMHLNTADLFPFVSEVRSGVAEVVRKQEAGWSYLH